MRIENLAGLGPANNLHVLELANKQVVDGYTANQGLLPGEAGQVLGNSLFNPVENNYGDNNYLSQAGTVMTIACGVTALLGVHVSCAWAILIPPAYEACCIAALANCFLGQCNVPIYTTGSFLNPFDPGFKPVYTYMPGEELAGTAVLHYGSSTDGTSHVTPENAGQHKIFFDWLAEDYSADTTALILSFLFNPLGMCDLSDSMHGSGAPHPSLSFTADSAESGMKDRIPPGGRTFSLLNQRSLASFTTTGTLNTLLTGRAGVDPTGNITRVYKLLWQRIEEIYPPAPDATAAQLTAHNTEITNLLASDKPIPMGAKAYIYLDDSGHLQLSVPPPAGADTLPGWLNAVKDEPADGVDLHASQPTLFEYRSSDERDRCYRVANPGQDFSEGPEVTAPTSDNYPTRVCSFDIYHFIPCSGYNNLLGVLRLGSAVERKCFSHGSLNAAPPWSQPDDCFCPAHPDGSKAQSNCLPAVF